MADLRFRELDTSSGYLDYRADFTPAETREWHERFKPRTTQGIFASDG